MGSTLRVHEMRVSSHRHTRILWPPRHQLVGIFFENFTRCAPTSRFTLFGILYSLNATQMTMKAWHANQNKYPSIFHTRISLIHVAAAPKHDEPLVGQLFYAKMRVDRSLYVYPYESDKKKPQPLGSTISTTKRPLRSLCEFVLPALRMRYVIRNHIYIFPIRYSNMVNKQRLNYA